MRARRPRLRGPRPRRCDPPSRASPGLHGGVTVHVARCDRDARARLALRVRQAAAGGTARRIDSPTLGGRLRRWCGESAGGCCGVRVRQGRVSNGAGRYVCGRPPGGRLRRGRHRAARTLRNRVVSCRGGRPAAIPRDVIAVRVQRGSRGGCTSPGGESDHWWLRPGVSTRARSATRGRIVCCQTGSWVRMILARIGRLPMIAVGVDRYSMARARSIRALASSNTG